MKSKIKKMRTRLSLIAAIVLLVGFGSSILIYLTAENVSDDVLGYENSKKFMHDMELYGGKANVLAYDFRRWFFGLWQGEALAFTIAFITIVISLGLFYLDRHLPSGPESDAG